MIVEKHYLIHGDYLSFRVRRNPDFEGPAREGGVLIEWQDDSENEWKGRLFISGSTARHVAEALQALLSEDEA